MSAGGANHRSRGMLTAIGVFRLLKAVLMLFVGLSLLGLLGESYAERLQNWASQLHTGVTSRLVNQAVQKLLTLPKSSKVGFACVAFVYTTLFTTEGIGLILAKAWAEWLTVVTTALLIPLEGYEIFEKPTWVRVGALVVNVAILVYLVWRIRADRQKK